MPAIPLSYCRHVVRHLVLALFLALGFAVYAAPGRAATTGATRTALTEKQCTSLAASDYYDNGKFPDFGDLADAPTQITSAKVAAARPRIPSYCVVEGYIAPQIGFHLRLPMEGWNGKFFQQGCGGMCGTVFAGEGCNAAVGRGYACIVTDMGHSGTQVDTKWTINNPQGMIDFAWRATHLATVAGKAITEFAYGSRPSKAYFNGCSTGGRQAFTEVQKFPEDYDGVIANAPASGMDAALQLLWSVQANYRKDGSQILTYADIDLLADVVMKQCDAKDGLADGIINDPRQCRPNLQSLGLSAEKVEAIRKIYDGPRDSKGRQWTEGAEPGTELRWKGEYVGDDRGPPHYESFMRDWFRRIGFASDPGKDWKIGDFDWDRDPPRARNAAALLGVWNPDISSFTDRGGKLLLLQGWADDVVMPGPMIRYYEKLAKLAGGIDKAKENARLFMIPGSFHCWRGPGADAVDGIAAIEDWVEKGKAPDKLIGYHPKTQSRTPVYLMPLPEEEVAFSRPYFPWPATTRYSGKGDPAKAESFVPAYPKAAK
ncbi:tannase/feruloyl esterase family alpha/beta hydrolase [Sphingobium aromaticivastans]|uniref:tannase/feruloyl esterase family alpha/beta hydrolase n=1 Tax=Sphingobium aromaticivastans TaxID=1778665 RepID=UPI0030191A97